MDRQKNYHASNSWKEKLNQDPRNDIEVIIGDDKQTPFQPQSKITRWNNEANLSARFQGLPEDKRDSIKFINNQIYYGDDKKKFRAYKKKHDNTEAWEMEKIYFEHPGNLTETLTLQVKQLEFSYQPPLDQEIDPGEGETVTATHHYDKDGNVLAHRPEDVVGSYAVYLARGKSWNRQSPNMEILYKLQAELQSRAAGNQPQDRFAHLDTTKKLEAEIAIYEEITAPELPYFKTYQTGKFTHIYRPKVIDVDGNEAWCDMNIDRDKGLMTITMPKKFMDNAAYPVVLDPEFGVDAGSPGGSSGSHAPDRWYGSNFTTPSDPGTIDSVSYYGRLNIAGTVGLKLGTINDPAYTILSNGITPAISVTSLVANWRTATYSSSPSISGSTSYVLAGICNDGKLQYYYDTGATNQGHVSPSASNSYTSPTDPTDFLFNNFEFSLYATYTTSSPSSFTSRNNTVI
jgi:hypothetical protein